MTITEVKNAKVENSEQTKKPFFAGECRNSSLRYFFPVVLKRVLAKAVRYSWIFDNQVEEKKRERERESEREREGKGGEKV